MVGMKWLRDGFVGMCYRTAQRIATARGTFCASKVSKNTKSRTKSNQEKKNWKIGNTAYEDNQKIKKILLFSKNTRPFLIFDYLFLQLHFCH